MILNELLYIGAIQAFTTATILILSNRNRAAHLPAVQAEIKNNCIYRYMLIF